MIKSVLLQDFRFEEQQQAEESYKGSYLPLIIRQIWRTVLKSKCKKILNVTKQVQLIWKLKQSNATSFSGFHGRMPKVLESASLVKN